MSEYLSISLKPRVKALLAKLPHERGPGWMDDLTRATFDLPEGAEFTPEQRRFTKSYFYAWAYSADFKLLAERWAKMGKEMEATKSAVRGYHEAMIEALSSEGRRLVISFARRPGRASILEMLNSLPAPEKPTKPDKRVRHSAKTGATWPKPKRSY